MGGPRGGFPLVRGWSRLLETQSWMWPAASFHRRGGVGTGAGRARACEAGAVGGSQATAEAPESQGAGLGGSGNPNPGGGTPSPTALSSPSVPVPAKIPPRPGKARGHRRTVESHRLVPSPTPPRSLHRAGGDGGGRGPQGKVTRTRRAEEGRRWRGAGGGPFSKTVSALLATRAAFRSRLSWACPQSV